MTAVPFVIAQELQDALPESQMMRTGMFMSSLPDDHGSKQLTFV
jgi:hypothetical protein